MSGGIGYHPGGGISHVILSGPLILAVPIAAAAGAVTFLSPCVLPLVPGYLSYVTGMSGQDVQGRRQPGRAGAQRAPVGAAAVAGARAAAGAGAAGGARAAASAGAAASSPGAAASSPGAAADSGGGADAGASPAAAGATARPQRRRAIVGTALFVVGFSAVFATEGVAFGSLGSLLKYHSGGLTQILGALTIVLGLLFAGVFDRFPLAGRVLKPSVRPRAGLAGAPVLGVLFGLGWTPCIGPTLSVVLLLATESGTAVRGAILMFAYGLGLGIPFLIVALAFQRGMTTFGFARRHARAITQAGGAMLIAVGVLEVTGAWSAALNWLQLHWVSNYSAPL
jgi:cytochrome c-type biogenesis protein